MFIYFYDACYAYECPPSNKGLNEYAVPMNVLPCSLPGHTQHEIYAGLYLQTEGAVGETVSYTLTFTSDKNSSQPIKMGAGWMVGCLAKTDKQVADNFTLQPGESHTTKINTDCTYLLAKQNGLVPTLYGAVDIFLNDLYPNGTVVISSP